MIKQQVKCINIIVPLGANISFTMELAIFALLKGSFPKEVRNCNEWHKNFLLSVYYFASYTFHIGGFFAVIFVAYLNITRGAFYGTCSEVQCDLFLVLTLLLVAANVFLISTGAYVIWFRGFLKKNTPIQVELQPVLQVDPVAHMEEGQGDEANAAAAAAEPPYRLDVSPED